MARIIKYLILLWNHTNYGLEHPDAERVQEHYKGLRDGKPMPKDRTLYELWLSGDLKPAFTSEGVTMT